ncbi:MAG TPA: cytidine deaminase [Candidatus Acidoferrales bacterium]|nr:cytidine deaminase [Candidatus Acidoferrales bacterium]
MPINKSIPELIEAAKSAHKKSEPAFSHFRVGAAIETEAGKIYSAFNIESSSYGLSMCAERIVLWKAIASGESKFKRMAIVSDAEDFCPPCGACRQVMLELAGDIEIYMTNRKGDVKKEKLSSLLPQAFTAKILSNGRD